MTSVLALSLLLAGPTPARGIQWEKSFDKAMALAQKHDKPILVDFWSLADEDLLSRGAARRALVARHSGSRIAVLAEQLATM